MSGSVVDFVSAALSGAYTPLVGEESTEAVAVLSGLIVSGVDGAGHAVSVGDEVSIGACLAGSGKEAESRIADTGVS